MASSPPSSTRRSLTVDAESRSRPVSHTVGYRFTHEGRTLLIIGDTSQSDNIRRFAESIDLLVHEALSPEIIGIVEDTGKDSATKFWPRSCLTSLTITPAHRRLRKPHTMQAPATFWLPRGAPDHCARTKSTVA